MLIITLTARRRRSVLFRLLFSLRNVIKDLHECHDCNDAVFDRRNPEKPTNLPAFHYFSCSLAYLHVLAAGSSSLNFVADYLHVILLSMSVLKHQEQLQVLENMHKCAKRTGQLLRHGRMTYIFINQWLAWT